MPFPTGPGFRIGSIPTIWLIPQIVDATGWRYGFAVLALGPAVGILAMRRLCGREGRRSGRL